VHTVRGAVRPPNHVRQAYGPGWALVGDAGYHRDAITGHGITDAFRDAELLARALHQALTGEADETDALASHQGQRDESLRQTFGITCALSEYPQPDRFIDIHNWPRPSTQRQSSWPPSPQVPMGNREVPAGC
jgi:hypothetical protein